MLLTGELQTRVSRNLPLGLVHFLENPRKQLYLMIYITKDITKDGDQDVPGHSSQFSLDMTVVNRPVWVPRASEFFAMSSSNYLETPANSVFSDLEGYFY